MSSRGWSGEGLGEEASEGFGKWAPPLETETPPPAEIREDENKEHAGGSVGSDVRNRTPTGGGSNVGSERGTPRRTETQTESRETRRDKEGTLGSEPLSPRARRMAQSVLDTPQGREMFDQLLARMVRQPAPGEEPPPARTTDGEIAEAAMSTPRALQGDAFSFDASRPSLPLESGMPRRQGMLPAWSAAPATEPSASMGGLGIGRSFSGQGRSYQTPSAHPQGPVVNRTHDHGGNYAPIVGIPTELRNAVKGIVPFYSNTATSERRRHFGVSPKSARYGRPDEVDGVLAVPKGQDRSSVVTPAQLWSRLKAAKRKRGKSVEEWGDRISTMCEALNYHEPRMRYEFFLDGLWNKQMKAVLNASMVTSISRSVRATAVQELASPCRGRRRVRWRGDGTTEDESSGIDGVSSAPGATPDESADENATVRATNAKRARQCSGSSDFSPSRRSNCERERLGFNTWVSTYPPWIRHAYHRG
ncbi:hypothetical protein PPTG_02069 [Phytophthora nicotianae INRA-310]|uniref:Uncharacterized protein n=1 Tax=Phytophthora nicotianae (strain INRA-310) TaxID=761204 RepID=W2RBT7_PHYN3|nr:hypothetical protein PPTG_02069 [Phytophthora nicotianae INRA-310]ETN22010.1 hypothetical protein PPTG_02069 [Phytophthora nicotianae INRA-310]